MYFCDIEYLISSIFLGRLTIFRNAILNPLSLGMELRLLKKSLLTLIEELVLSLSNASMLDSHNLDTSSSLSFDGEKNFSDDSLVAY